MRSTVYVAAGLACAALTASACHSDPEPTTPTTPTPTVTTPPPTTTATPMPSATATPMGGPATQVSPSQVPEATPIIAAAAKTDARGMQPDGSAFAGQFQEGQTLDQTFNAAPGKCYTVIAYGVGITQLDIVASTLSPSPAIPSITVAQSNTTGSAASIGAGTGNCVKYPLPIGGPFKITLKATHGAGMAVGQVFSK